MGQLLEIGRIIKPHGLRGEVVVELITNRSDRLAPGAEFTGPHGTLVVTSSRPFQERHLVQFDGVSSREDGEQLRGVVLRAAASPGTDGDALWVHELIGAEVRDGSGAVLGTVQSVEDNPASDLLVLDDGGLIPCRFVVSQAEGVVVVDIPEGLLEP